jgi:hypothetical protein
VVVSTHVRAVRCHEKSSVKIQVPVQWCVVALYD